MPFQQNNNRKTNFNRKLTASISLVRTTNKLATTVNLLNKSINLIGVSLCLQNQIQTDLKRHVSNLHEYGGYLTTAVIPSLITGNIAYDVSRNMNKKNATQDHSVMIYPSSVSPSKRARLSPMVILSNNLPFPVSGTQNSPEEAMNILANNTT